VICGLIRVMKFALARIAGPASTILRQRDLYNSALSLLSHLEGRLERTALENSYDKKD